MAAAPKPLVISGVNIPFFDLVRFFIKVFFAMIPASLLVGAVIFMLQVIFGGALLGIMAAGAGAG